MLGSTASILGASNAIFNGTIAYVEVAKPSTTAELATALDCFIECANMRLRSLPGPVPDERPAESPRPRLGAEPLPSARLAPPATGWHRACLIADALSP